MGYTHAQEYADMLDIDTALTMQLRTNHYPPVPLEMVPVCKEAIEAVNDYDFEREIELPAGVLYKGLTTAPASAIVEQHHLGPWVYVED